MSGAQAAGSPRVGWVEWVRVSAGAVLGLAAVGLLSHFAETGTGWTQAVWLVAPIGASAVIVFALPSSPLGRPWSVIGGNTLGTLMGIVCAAWIGPTWIAAGVAVGAAIALMLQARCLHPPGGAAALLAVLTHTTDWRFALMPVALNSALLVAAAWLWHAATRRPHPAPPEAAEAMLPNTDDLSSAIDAAVTRYGEVLDIDRTTLRNLLEEAQTQAYRQRLDAVSCADIMQREVQVARPDESVAEAQDRLIEHGIKALPVIDRHRQVVGIVTAADLRLNPEGAPSAMLESSTPVAARMTRQVRVVSQTRHLSELIPLFASSGHHHLPVIDASARLVGMITQSDVMRALHRTPQANPTAPPSA
ncbi:HPP family protein [Thiomonas bhubaneswarensis]|uniref:CBS-domain-containing membrane protein n=1 Tax=Thiomonas bhubaneswarensis TaxID=339866 RepID=A0A0K6HUQ4_9BURK|nr:HPP family protein [Thiomonas bhubaneswarensis]CUA94523.1 CBS-domain-containing membrane protein [Thiomonas bhubaneswarensis]